MRAYHRIVGDPPRRGFGSDIASVGFPGGNWAAALQAGGCRLWTAFRFLTNSAGIRMH